MKFLICGYYGFGNAGDELLLSSTIQLLHAAHHAPDICVLSKEPRQTMKEHPVHAVSRNNPFAIIHQVTTAERVIIGGGGLLQDFTGPLTLYYYLAIAFAGIICKKRTVFHAIGANELNAFNARLCSFVLNRCAVVSVRDKRSAELLSRWGVEISKISLTADPVFALSAILQPQPRSVVLLVLRHNSNISRYLKALPAVEKLAAAKIVVLPFQPGRDGTISIELSRAVPESVSLGLWHDLPSLVCRFDECALVIAERYHALVLAAMRGVPAICVSDDDKLIRFARECDYPVLRPSDNFDPTAIIALVERLWKYRETLRTTLLRKSAAQNELARKNPALV